MSQVDDEIVSNRSANPPFAEVLGRAVTRRAVLAGGLATAAAAFLAGRRPGTGIDLVSDGSGSTMLGFTGVPASTADTVVVPDGYTARVLISWGDPISDGPAFAPDASNTAADQERQWGMHNDALHFFPIGQRRGLLVQNHEYTDDGLLFPDGVADWNAEKTAKSLAAHGVSVIEIEDGPDGWQVVRPSERARRITGSTPIAIAGPAAGHALLRTSADPEGTTVLGTLNNCAHGYTPWNTYLTCEENVNGYFRKTAEPTPDEDRYGISAEGFGYLWHTTDPRFRVDDEPNEVNRFGWVTEFDPMDPASTPVQRTALGRVKHEGAKVVETADGRVVVYMGDDERFEYVYRYVGAQPWREALEAGAHPLDDGTLFVARFADDGTGEWLALTPDNPDLAGFADQADILVRTRQAADAAGATPMDRPEWIDVDPSRGFVYVTLTNNDERAVEDGAPTDAANPRAENVYGHILRWQYAGDHADDTFRWEVFLLAGDPENLADGSTVVGDRFGSPDGIYVDPAGRIWIQTDVSTSTIDIDEYAGFGNNQMLAADPWSGETRRFLVGPRNCEVTGVEVTPDGRSMFVGIQHPGERPDDEPGDPADPTAISSWPDGASGTRPRSSTIVVTRDDGGVIGA
ncbi:MAG TPA: PhoX family phosphatase [Pseudonocardia sp.]|nr:PhoX family phosphatase [Pseudonocardia sp.]